MKNNWVKDCVITVCICAVFLLIFFAARNSYVPKNEDIHETAQTIIQAVRAGHHFFVIHNEKPTMPDLIDLIYDDESLFGIHGTHLLFSFGNFHLLLIRNYCRNTDAAREEIDAVADSVIAGIDEDLSEYEKVLAVHDWICQNVTYETLEDHSDQDIRGVFLYKKAVCSGYAKAFSYLLNKLNIRSSTVGGFSTIDVKNTEKESRHLWNLAYIDGQPYYFDVTWDDSSSGAPLYEWFGMTAEQCQESHRLREGYEWADATSTEGYYYIHNGSYVSQYSAASLSEQFAQLGNKFTLKCKDAAVMQDVLDALHTPKELNKILYEAGIENCKGLQVTTIAEYSLIDIEIIFNE